MESTVSNAGAVDVQCTPRVHAAVEEQTREPGVEEKKKKNIIVFNEKERVWTLLIESKFVANFKSDDKLLGHQLLQEYKESLPAQFHLQDYKAKARALKEQSLLAKADRQAKRAKAVPATVVGEKEVPRDGERAVPRMKRSRQRPRAGAAAVPDGATTAAPTRAARVPRQQGNSASKTSTDSTEATEQLYMDAIVDGPDKHGRFLVKWEGYPTSENTWEPPEHIPAGEIALFMAEQQQQREEKPVENIKNEILESVPPSPPAGAASPTMDPDIFYMDYIVDGPDNRGRFLVKWEGYPSSENTWEPTDNLPADAVALFRKEKKQREKQRVETGRNGIKVEKDEPSCPFPPKAQASITKMFEKKQKEQKNREQSMFHEKKPKVVFKVEECEPLHSPLPSKAAQAFVPKMLMTQQKHTQQPREKKNVDTSKHEGAVEKGKQRTYLLPQKAQAASATQTAHRAEGKGFSGDDDDDDLSTPRVGATKGTTRNQGRTEKKKMKSLVVFNERERVWTLFLESRFVANFKPDDKMLAHQILHEYKERLPAAPLDLSDWKAKARALKEQTHQRLALATITDRTKKTITDGTKKKTPASSSSLHSPPPVSTTTTNGRKKMQAPPHHPAYRRRRDIDNDNNDSDNDNGAAAAAIRVVAKKNNTVTATKKSRTPAAMPPVSPRRGPAPFSDSDLHGSQDVTTLWGPLEEMALKEGVRLYGEGRWDQMFRCPLFRGVWEFRSAHQLAEKWDSLKDAAALDHRTDGAGFGSRVTFLVLLLVVQNHTHESTKIPYACVLPFVYVSVVSLSLSLPSLSLSLPLPLSCLPLLSLSHANPPFVLRTLSLSLSLSSSIALSLSLSSSLSLSMRFLHFVFPSPPFLALSLSRLLCPSPPLRFYVLYGPYLALPHPRREGPGKSTVVVGKGKGRVASPSRKRAREEDRNRDHRNETTSLQQQQQYHHHASSSSSKSPHPNQEAITARWKPGGLRQRLWQTIKSGHCPRCGGKHPRSLCTAPPKSWEADFDRVGPSFWTVLSWEDEDRYDSMDSVVGGGDGVRQFQPFLGHAS
jgi:hypothetical protein